MAMSNGKIHRKNKKIKKINRMSPRSICHHDNERSRQHFFR